MSPVFRLPYELIPPYMPLLLTKREQSTLITKVDGSISRNLRSVLGVDKEKAMEKICENFDNFKRISPSLFRYPVRFKSCYMLYYLTIFGY